jgi:hypothetical protein
LIALVMAKMAPTSPGAMCNVCEASRGMSVNCDPLKVVQYAKWLNNITRTPGSLNKCFHFPSVDHTTLPPSLREGEATGELALWLLFLESSPLELVLALVFFTDKAGVSLLVTLVSGKRYQFMAATTPMAPPT